ncbi:MAG: DegV family protein [Bacilli bacterium]|nr:DegV family protein [Bacilli bacterium]MBN2697105.1 DegV family protein [Bacilli bacterium]
MIDYVLITDSCADLPDQLLKKLEVEVIPLSVLVDGETYYNYPDEREITFKEFYELLRQKKSSSTSQLNPEQFLEKFTGFLEAGKDILSISFSSALSGTYESSLVASEELRKKYPDRKIITIDSKCASMGQGLLIHHAATKRLQGESLEDLGAWCEENKLNVSHLFTVGDLNHLKRGGRLSSGKAFLGTLMNVKPLLHVNLDGKLVQTGAARGRRLALNKMVERMRLTIDKPKEQTIFISHGDCIEDVEYLKEQIALKVPVKGVIDHYIGPVIGSHSGLGTIAIFYFGNDRTTAY